MKPRLIRLVVALAGAALFVAPFVRADEEGLLPGHSSHGDAFNEGPRQAAYLMEGTGKVDFPISTKKPLAQKFFNQGVGQLHGFWYFEAERSFRQVLALDTNCAMAYWGMAMANVNNEKRAKEFIKQAVAKEFTASKREQLWIDGLSAFYTADKGNKAKRQRDFIRSLENIVQEHPKDLEAKAFLACFIWEYNKELPITSHQAVDSLLDQIFAVEPMHPANHYRIHLWNSEKDQRALGAAARCGQAAPGIAHMWHMPGHTFSKLKRYDDAAWQQEAAARTDHAYMIKNLVLPDQIHNYAHNDEWLIRDLSLIGRVHDAVELAKNMIELPRHPKFNTLDKRSASGSYGRQRLIEVLTRYELWKDLIALSQTMYLEPAPGNPDEIRRLRSLGIAYFNTGDVEQGKKQIAALEAIAKNEAKSTNRTNAAKSNAAKSGGAKKESTKTDEAKVDSTKESYDKEGDSAPKGGDPKSKAGPRKGPPAKATDTALAELRGWLSLANGQTNDARKQFDLATDIFKERQSQIQLRLGDLKKAEQLARDAAKTATNEVQIIANFVEVLYRCGKTDEAKTNFTKLRECSASADLDAPMFARLSRIAPELGLPADWKLPMPKRTDVGRRPKLDSLGPFRWHPTAAPDWTLPGLDGKPTSLAQFRGQPVLVIFYLGHGCIHCIQQLNAFAPVTKDFAKAGISLVAIATDSVAGLKTTLEKSQPPGFFPFPLLSDDKLKAFKAYRAFDDFEQIALHGTYLIDGDGMIRWLDIAYEPFTDTKFLLAEAQRLLNIPPTASSPNPAHAKR